jgi:hypothetical protein
LPFLSEPKGTSAAFRARGRKWIHCLNYISFVVCIKAILLTRLNAAKMIVGLGNGRRLIPYVAPQSLQLRKQTPNFKEIRQLVEKVLRQ